MRGLRAKISVELDLDVREVARSRVKVLGGKYWGRTPDDVIALCGRYALSDMVKPRFCFSSRRKGMSAYYEAIRKVKESAGLLPE